MMWSAIFLPSLFRVKNQKIQSTDYEYWRGVKAFFLISSEGLMSMKLCLTIFTMSDYEKYMFPS